MHAHNHHHGGTRRVLALSLAATIVFIAVEVWTGVAAGSLALLSDAGHNFTDAIALVLAIFGIWIQARPADEFRTWGWHRAGVLAAFVNALSLVALSAYLLWESVERLRAPQPVEEFTMVIVAGLGLLLNAGIVFGLRRSDRHDLNIRAATVHMLGDAAGSVAIIAGALAMRYTGWTAIDPLLSILISLLIVWSAVAIIRDTLNILLEALPSGMRLDDVRTALRGVPGVLDIHDVHVWSLGVRAHALSCHAQIADVPLSESRCVLAEINRVLAGRFGIHHTTIQFEHLGCALAESGCSICVQPANSECCRT